MEEEIKKLEEKVSELKAEIENLEQIIKVKDDALYDIEMMASKAR